MIKKLLCICVFYLCCSGLAWAAEVTLGWQPNTETDLAGYKLYRGIESGIYDTVVDTGDVISYTDSTLEDGVTYYYSLTAYDTSNNESGYSNEVSYNTPPVVLIKTPSGFTIVGNVSLRWYKHRDTSVEGYYVYYGAESGVYTEKVKVIGRDITRKSLTLPAGIYYFRVSAYNSVDIESFLSAEIRKEVSLDPVEGFKIIE